MSKAQNYTFVLYFISIVIGIDFTKDGRSLCDVTRRFLKQSVVSQATAILAVPDFAHLNVNIKVKK